MAILRSLLGMCVLLAIAFAFSTNRRRVRPRVVLAALLSQIAIGAFVLFVPLGKEILAGAADGVNRVLNYGESGIQFLFGGLVSAKMMQVFGSDGFVFAFRVLPAIIFVTSLISVLYYVGIMKWVVITLGSIFHKVIGVTKIESFSAASTIFLGQSEMPAMVKPFVKKCAAARFGHQAEFVLTTPARRRSEQAMRDRRRGDRNPSAPDRDRIGAARPVLRGLRGQAPAPRILLHNELTARGRGDSVS